MPIYEYECSKCGKRFEKRRNFSDSDKELKCPECGAVNPQRVISCCAISTSGQSAGDYSGGGCASSPTCGSGGGG